MVLVVVGPNLNRPDSVLVVVMGSNLDRPVAIVVVVRSDAIVVVVGLDRAGGGP